MNKLTIPHLDDDTLARLRARAKAGGRSEADEARQILEDSLKPPVGPTAPDNETPDFSIVAVVC